MNTINITKKDGYSIVQIARGKANAVNQEMVTELRATFAEMEKDNTVQGVILTGTTNFFSAGLDLIELYGYDEQQMRDFFISFGLMHVELARFTKPFICAITGYCPAGGTVIAITADYRVMADNPKFSIGLNEMAVNVQISQNLIEGYSYWLGSSLANEKVLDGHLFSPEEALEANLVNQVCGADEVLPAAEKQMKKYLYADPDIFKNTKAKLRKNWLGKLNDDSTDELDEALGIWWKPEVRTKMKALIESFSNKKK